ncbi:MAG: hypothetical protein LBK58_11685 [Prevotellaceae bacterium]|jgi:hypothetical protein|nr:hypothetical protein [Prevotellaceae bacterium]
MDNRISFSLDEARKQRILAALKVLDEDLLPSLVELAQDEARELPVMGDKSYVFVFKALEYAKQYPKYAALIVMTEFEKDVKAVGQLREFYVPLSQLTRKLQDTMTLAGSEAYVAGLTCYASSKEGVKRNVPNAILIAEEPGKRFSGHSRAKRKNKRNIAMHKPAAAFTEYACAGRTVEFFYPQQQCFCR